MRSRIYPYNVSLTSGQSKYTKIVTENFWFAFKKITTFSTGDYEARYIVDGKPISKKRTSKVNAAGVANYPFIQTAWAFAGPHSDIFVDILDLSSASNAVNINFIGVEGTKAEIMRLIGNAKAWPFWFPGSVVLGANAEGTILINTDAEPFRLIKLIAESTGAFEANISAGPLTVSRSKIRNSTLYGSAQLPLIIDPWDVTNGVPIEIDLKDLSGATNTVKVNHVGHKIF